MWDEHNDDGVVDTELPSFIVQCTSSLAGQEECFKTRIVRSLAMIGIALAAPSIL
jgi:hypothetical protein